MRELVFAGFGGQGVLTAGLIVSQIALFKGVNATWMPAYGAAQRGGTANCTVKYGEEKIYNPGQQRPDLVPPAAGVGDEGGYAPNLKKDEDAFKCIVAAIEKAGYKPGEDFMLAIDAAVSDWYNHEDPRHRGNAGSR